MEQHIRHLFESCEQGGVGNVQAVLEQGLGVDTTDGEDNTALHVAAANGHEQVVRLLLMRGAGLDKVNTWGWTPLLQAARHGHTPVVILLLQNKADLNARTRLGASAIHLAACGGHIQTVRLLVEAGIDMTPSAGAGIGTTCELNPLMSAAQHGHDAVVRFLLDRGADVNYRTPSTGINSLMLAALNGHMTTAQILIERGGDPNLTNVNDMTSLQIATLRGKREVRGYLDRKTTNKPKIAPEDVKPDIIEAAKNGDLQRIKDILDGDPSQRDASSPHDGATPLMFAAMMGRLDVAQLLVERGCDVDKQDTVSGWTALMQATYHGKKVIAKYLIISAGADVSVPAKNGCTAFDMASLIDDMDTELYRLLAAKAVQLNNKPEKSKSRTWATKTPGALQMEQTTPVTEEQPKTGLRAWWNRMSNRFRNLKLGRTFTMTTNRLAPLPEPSPQETTATMKSKNSPKVEKPSAESPSLRTSPSHAVDTATTVASIASVESYDTILLETKKSANVYTLGLTPSNPNIVNGNLKPVIPPFFPSPSFDNIDRPKMPPVNNRRSMVSLDGSSTMTPVSPTIKPFKFLNNHSNSSLSTSPASPSNSGRFQYSPASSGGASSISAVLRNNRVPSSASSSTLTAGSDFHKSNSLKSRSDSQQNPLFVPASQLPPVRPPSFLLNHRSSNRSPGMPLISASSATSPGSSISGTSSLLPKKNSRAKSASSKESTSTLTPSPSPTPKATESTSSETPTSSQPMDCINEDDDELKTMLKKLSLERYQPIFEEQEVDMEAFLTLTDNDLKELGIAHTEPRRQILTAITELESGKGRERQQFQAALTTFQSTMRSRSSIATSVAEENYANDWNSLEGEKNPQDPGLSTKSRSS